MTEKGENGNSRSLGNDQKNLQLESDVHFTVCRRLPAVQEPWVQSLGKEDTLEKKITQRTLCDPMD